MPQLLHRVYTHPNKLEEESFVGVILQSLAKLYPQPVFYALDSRATFIEKQNQQVNEIRKAISKEHEELFRVIHSMTKEFHEAIKKSPEEEFYMILSKMFNRDILSQENVTGQLSQFLIKSY